MPFLRTVPAGASVAPASTTPVTIASAGRPLAPPRANRTWTVATLPVLLLPAAAWAQTADAELPSVKVVARPAASAPLASEAAGAKTDLPVRELPQSVRVLGRQAVDDLAATRLDDVLDFVGGVTRQNDFGGLWDNVAVRGFSGDPNVGMPALFNGFAASRGFNAPRDLATVERVEFLKGPAAALYGSSEPGGVLNIVAKRPRWEADHTVGAALGSHQLRRATLDTTGPLGDAVAYRLNVAAEDRASVRDHVTSERRVLAPALTWRAGADTVVDYTGEFLRHRAPLDRGIVAVDNALGQVPRERFLGEPGDGDVTVENQVHQLVVAHEWNEAWRSRVGLSYRETALDGFATEPVALQPDRQLTRQRRYRDYTSDDVALQAELQGRLGLAGMTHDVLLGVETYRFETNSWMLRVNPTPTAPYAIDIDRPVYGQPLPTPAPNTDTRDQQRNTAVYLQDAVTLAPTWRAVGGVRVDHHRQTVLNRRTGTAVQQDATATSPRLGVSWVPSSQWTVYANTGRSFRPNTGTDFAGAAFDDESGRALELGAKWTDPDGQLAMTAALFHIRKRNVLTTDPVNPGYSRAAGAVRSRGAEWDLTGRLARQWRVLASATWQDVVVTEDDTLEVGSRVLNVPKVSASVLAVYEDRLPSGQAYGAGAGVVHVGTRLGQARTQAEARRGDAAFELPAYTTVKLVGHWQATPALRVTLDVANLFDRAHYTSSYSRVWVAPGTDRTATLGVQATF